MKGACFTLLDFEPTESPVWQRHDLTSWKVLTINEMLDNIIVARKQWEEIRYSENCDKNKIENITEELEVLFIHYTCQQEGVGLTDEGKIREIIGNYRDGKCTGVLENLDNSAYLETVNLYEAYQMLKDLGKKEAESDPQTKGLLDLESCVIHAHKRLMRGLSAKTRGGVFSTEIRQTMADGELHQYPKFETVTEAKAAVMRILDRYNMLCFSIIHEEPQDERLFLLNFFKCATWLFYEMLSLHPFGDGNGRLCRLLLNYVVHVFTPFPVPLYDIYRSNRATYLDAVIAPRKSDGRPKDLMRLIVESMYVSWNTFINDLKWVDVKAIDFNNCLSSDEDLEDEVQTQPRDGESTGSCRSLELNRMGLRTDLRDGRNMLLVF